MPFIIRHQGFFYNGDFYEESGAFRQLHDQTFATREQAEQARHAATRDWIRDEALGQFLMDSEHIEKLDTYLQSQWSGIDFTPDFRVPAGATDAQLDAIAQILDATFVQVFEAGGQDSDDEELYFGPAADS